MARRPPAPGLAAGAVLVAAMTIIAPAAAFQTPIIFPLLWMAKRLTRHHQLGTPIVPRIPLVPPLATALMNLVAVKDAQKKDGAAEMIAWLDNMEGSSSCVKVDSNAQGLRGLYAQRDIRSGEIVVEIPYDAALLVGDTLWATIFDDFDDVPGRGDWGEEDLDDAYQGLNFLQTLVSDPGYAPYVASLPEKPSSGDEAGLTPDFWSKERIQELEVPSYVKKILDRKQIVEEVAKKNNVDEDELRWATWMIRSRRFTTWNMVDDPDAEDESLFGVIPTRRKQIEQIQGYLLPLVDMANHAQDPNAVLKISVNRWTREFDDTSTFALRALRPIGRGEEVTIAYGDSDLTSMDLMDKYGFFLEGNEADETIDWDELEPAFTTSLEEDEAELAMLEGRGNEGKHGVLSKTTDKLKTLVSKIQDYEPGFSSKLDDLYLIGSGVRQKMGIQVYGVAMYGTKALLDAASHSSLTLRKVARTFDEASPRTTFVLEMILSADADIIAEAISDSVKVRYGGPPADVLYLESLIAEGVKERGGQSTKGCLLQFDCTGEGIGVSVDGVSQGTAKFSELGSAFVDVFTDANAVSLSLISNCLGNKDVGNEQANGSAASEKLQDRNVSASRQTVLSLRVLMKRLSNWKGKSAVTPADGPAVNGGLVQQEAAIEPETIDSTGIEPKAIAESVPIADSVDAEADILAGDGAINGEDAPASVSADESAAQVSPPDTGVATEDLVEFDANAVETRIQELEAEIEAEIARVKSLGLPIDEAPTVPDADVGSGPSNADTANTEEAEAQQAKAAAVESIMKPLKDKATGVEFDPKLGEGLYLVGVGVRKKAIINVYSVAIYSSPSAIESLSPFPKSKQKDAQTALRNAARAFDAATPTTTFVLEMVFKADGASIAGAISEGVRPRYNGPAGDVKELEGLIIAGLKSKGGQATKGTVFRFDCTNEGVSVSVDGNMQGTATFEGMGSAFVDVFVDDKAVSPQLVSSCLDTWCGSGL